MLRLREKSIKSALYIFGGLILVALIFFGSIFYMGKKSADDVRNICEIEIGAPIKDIIPKARSMGFSEAKQGALDGGLVVFTEPGDRSTQLKIFDDTLSDLNSGSIRFGKTSLPPFLRNYCEISFKRNVVTTKRIWTLD